MPALLGGVQEDPAKPDLVPRTIIPEAKQPNSGNALYVFALPERTR